MRILNADQEAVLKAYVDFYENATDGGTKKGGWSCPDLNELIDDSFGGNQFAVSGIIKILRYGGYFHEVPRTLGMGWCEQLSSVALNYFSDKEKYLEQKTKTSQNNSSTTNIFNAPIQQANIATANAVIYATQNNGIDSNQLLVLIEAVMSNIPSNITNEDLQTIKDSLETITELKESKPKMGLIRTAFTALNGLKYTAEFGAAVTALYTFARPFL